MTRHDSSCHIEFEKQRRGFLHFAVFLCIDTRCALPINAIGKMHKNSIKIAVNFYIAYFLISLLLRVIYSIIALA